MQGCHSLTTVWWMWGESSREEAATQIPALAEAASRQGVLSFQVSQRPPETTFIGVQYDTHKPLIPSYKQYK